MPTPNDTRWKQFLTAIFLTVLFAIGIAIAIGLFYWSIKMFAAPGWLTQTTGWALCILGVMQSLVVIIAGVFSMIDWMRSTVPPVATPAVPLGVTPQERATMTPNRELTLSNNASGDRFFDRRPIPFSPR